MLSLSRQVPAVDVSSLLSVVWLVIFLGIFFWFYNAIKRIEQTLEGIRKQLEAKAKDGT